MGTTGRETGRRPRRRKGRLGCLGGVLALVLILAAGALGLPRLLELLTPAPAYDGLQIGYNRTPCRRSARSIRYIVIHDTANPSPGADARRHYAFFNSGNQDSSADFFVDSGGALQVNDYYRYYTWHCGDGGPRAAIRNDNSVGVEICINRDGDYARAKAEAAALTRRLMKELHIDKAHVVRHMDASGKQCPGTMSQADWEAFLASL